MDNEKLKILKKAIDLHIHSVNSDGDNTIEELIQLAHQEALRVIAITDHNMFSITEQLHIGNLTVIPAAEFSATYGVAGKDTTEIHIIGLFPDGVNPDDFFEIFKDIDKGKMAYVKAVLKSLEGRGIEITLEEVNHVKYDCKFAGRYQISKVMVNKGYTQSIEDSMDNYIGNFSPYYIPSSKYINYASLNTIVQQIRKSGGIPILAHPYGYALNEAEIEQLIIDFKKVAGALAGMEVYYERYLQEKSQVNFLRKMQKKYNLLASASSDRHRVEQPFASAGDIKLFEDMIAAYKNNRKSNSEY